MTTQAFDLLEETVSTLREKMAPQARGEIRYLTLLTANAVATAARELRMAGQLDALEHAVAADGRAIRAGKHDRDAELYRQLVHVAAIRAWIADPDNLDERERTTFIDDTIYR
ncbi:MAG: hypothetical protein KDG54_05955 [Geminicoccaceae bacterium]|nr:hypothetical protein [Geminicoccaceae bacterium]